MNIDLKTHFGKMQHLAPPIGRAYLLLASLYLQTDDMKDLMAAYTHWLQSVELQQLHNAQPDKTEHLQQWIAQSRQIGNNKHLYQQTIVQFLQTHIASTPDVIYILDELFGVGEW